MPLRALLVVAAIAFVLSPEAAFAACVNKYVSRSEGSARQVVTLLTGKLTFQEADALAKAIESKQSPPVEWVDGKGKAIAKQLGELKVIRPMPVGCDGRTSGVVVVVTFVAVTPPSSKINIKLDANTTVEFEQQKD